MKYLSLICFVFVVFYFPLTAQTGSYSGGGDGTSQANAIQIATTNDLIELSNTSDDWGLHFIQTSDIEFDSNETQVDWDGDGTLEWAAGGDDTKGLSTIGYNPVFFTGVYDGGGFKITNLYMASTTNQPLGLFGYTSEATITNITMKNINQSGNWQVAGIAGYAYLSDITNCHVDGKINNSGAYTAGIIGYSWESNVAGCSFSGTILSAGDYSGGLVGTGNGNTNSSLTNSYVSGYVYSTGEQIGGLVGSNTRFQIQNCYVSGAVSGNDRVGGLTGNNENVTITNSYASGNIYGTTSTYGLTGSTYSSSNLINCYFDNQTTNQTVNYGGTAFITEQFKTTANFNTNWNIDYSGGADDTHPWLSNSNGRPFLYYQNASVCGEVIELNLVNFNVLSNNGAQITETGIRYTKCSSVNWNYQQVGSTEGNESYVLSGLDYGDDYFAQAYAVDNNGNYFYGDMCRFTAVATIAFNANGGEGAMSLQGIEQSQTVSLTLNEFTRTGYVFEGWNTKDDGSGTAYANEAAFTLSATSDVTLYAQWSPVEYSITYHLDEGTNSAANPTIYTIESDNILLEAATKAGYSFNGWFIDEELTSSITEITSGSTGDIELWAKWQGTTGIASTANINSLKFYPNPVKDVLNIEFEKPYSGPIKLFDLNGAEVLQVECCNSTYANIAVANIPSGIYLILVDNNYRTRKIIVK